MGQGRRHFTDEFKQEAVALLVQHRGGNAQLACNLAQRPAHHTLAHGISPDSPLEGDGSEPSVPHKKTTLFGCPRSVPQFAFRNKNRLFRAGDRWFESISLQRRVMSNSAGCRESTRFRIASTSLLRR